MTNDEGSPDSELRNPESEAFPEAFQVVVECRDEPEQQAVFERLTGEGYACKLLTL